MSKWESTKESITWILENFWSQGPRSASLRSVRKAPLLSPVFAQCISNLLHSWIDKTIVASSQWVYKQTNKQACTKFYSVYASYYACTHIKPHYPSATLIIFVLIHFVQGTFFLSSDGCQISSISGTIPKVEFSRWNPEISGCIQF